MSLVSEYTQSLQRGMNDSTAATAFRNDECAQLLNYYVTPDGKAQVRRGNRRTHTAALNSGADGFGGIEFRLASGTVQWCVFVGNKFYISTDEGVNWTEKATGLPEAYWSLVTFRRSTTNYLLAANGGTNTYEWDGTTWAAVSNIPNDTKFLAVHNGRLWSYVDGNTLTGSAIDDFETYAIDGVEVEVLTHDGDAEVSALFQFGTVLVAGKRKSIAYVDGFGNADLIVATGSRGISDEVGILAFRSVAQVEGDAVIFLSERGFEYLQFGSKPVLISAGIQNFMNSISWSEILETPGLPQGYYYPDRGTYECVLPAVGEQNTHTFVYRLPSGGRPGAASLHTTTSGTATGTVFVDDGYLSFQDDGSREQVRTESNYLSTAGALPGLYVEITGGYLSLGTADSYHATVFMADTAANPAVPVAVGYDGFVRRVDIGEADDELSTGSGGDEINAVLVSRPKLFGDPFRGKRGRIVRVNAISDAGAVVALSLIADGAEGTPMSKTLDPATNDQPKEVRAFVSGRGNTLQAKVVTSKADLKVSDIELQAQPLVRPV